ncbi:MAG: molybdate ABC transporter substrate-binding protein [Mariniphaga sp.]|nr:molybdate ABC transporter substrate-binding protein [Mariniphaga sp.]
MKKTILLIITTILIISCNEKKNKPQLIVFCAASLTDVMLDIESKFEKSNDINIKLNIASSGTLARQIEHGAPADIFISANKKWMDHTENLGLIEVNTISRIAGNSLVIIVPLSSLVESIPFKPGASFPDSFQGRLSIGDPEYVPAGTYAREALQNAGFYNNLKNRIIPAKDVRSALMVVELGEVEVGIVYKTDAQKSKKVKIVGEIPDTFHLPIGYYSAVIKEHKTELTMNFYTFIISDQAKLIWKKYGFIL